MGVGGPGRKKKVIPFVLILIPPLGLVLVLWLSNFHHPNSSSQLVLSLLCYDYARPLLERTDRDDITTLDCDFM